MCAVHRNPRPVCRITKQKALLTLIARGLSATDHSSGRIIDYEEVIGVADHADQYSCIPTDASGRNLHTGTLCMLCPFSFPYRYI